MWDRIEFSVFASVLFNFGSLMFSVLFKALLPKRLNTSFAALLGASVSTWMITRGTKYLRHIDSRTVIPLPGLSKLPLPNGESANGVPSRRIAYAPLPPIAEAKPLLNGHLISDCEPVQKQSNGFVPTQIEAAKFVGLTPLLSEQRTMA